MKRRINFDGEQGDYLACDSLQAHGTKLYKDADMKARLSRTHRQSFAYKLLSNAAYLCTVQQLPRQAELNYVYRV